MTRTSKRRRRTSWMMALAMLAMSAPACYLPKSDVERTLAEQVLVAVYRCSAAVTGGEISNDSDVPLVVTIRPRWLDATRTAYHEVDLEPITVPAGSFVDWEADAGADIAAPQFCEAETVAVEEAS